MTLLSPSDIGGTKTLLAPTALEAAASRCARSAIPPSLARFRRPTGRPTSLPLIPADRNASHGCFAVAGPGDRRQVNGDQSSWQLESAAVRLLRPATAWACQRFAVLVYGCPI